MLSIIFETVKLIKELIDLFTDLFKGTAPNPGGKSSPKVYVMALVFVATIAILTCSLRPDKYIMRYIVLDPADRELLADIGTSRVTGQLNPFAKSLIDEQVKEIQIAFKQQGVIKVRLSRFDPVKLMEQAHYFMWATSSDPSFWDKFQEYEQENDKKANVLKDVTRIFLYQNDTERQRFSTVMKKQASLGIKVLMAPRPRQRLVDYIVIDNSIASKLYVDLDDEEWVELYFDTKTINVMRDKISEIGQHATAFAGAPIATDASKGGKPKQGKTVDHV